MTIICRLFFAKIPTFSDEYVQFDIFMYTCKEKRLLYLVEI